MLEPQATVCDLSSCGSLDENGSHQLIHSIACFLLDGTVWEEFGGVALLESLEVGFEGSKALPSPIKPISLPCHVSQLVSS